MEKTKKYIAPGAWFAMAYPAAWSEFEDGEGSFLFYNPDEWTGNFRISAYRGNKNYGIEAMEAELRENPSATQVRVGQWKCAYSKEMFQEGGDYYTQHLWVTGQGNTAFEITFTVTKGGDVSEAQDIIASLEARKEGMKYPAELIPVRLSEIYQINEAYEWVEKGTKELLKKDFQGTEADIDSMQQFVDQSGFPPKKKKYGLG